MKIIFILTLILALISCSSTTIIKTDDPEVSIAVNGKPKGKGSIVHTDMKMSWLSSDILLTKEGCETQKFSINKNGQLDVQSLITGIILILPLVWIMKYDALYEFPFECKS